MKVEKLASTIAKREGKKSVVKIGDVREILRIIKDLVADDLVERYSATVEDLCVDKDGVLSGLLTESIKQAQKICKAKKSI